MYWFLRTGALRKEIEVILGSRAAISFYVETQYIFYGVNRFDNRNRGRRPLRRGSREPTAEIAAKVHPYFLLLVARSFMSIYRSNSQTNSHIHKPSLLHLFSFTMDMSRLENVVKSSTSESSRNGSTTDSDSQEQNPNVTTLADSSSSSSSNNETDNVVSTSSEQSRGGSPSDEGQESLLQKKWDEMFNRLCKYKEAYGDCLVPNRYPEDPQLGNWGKLEHGDGFVIISGNLAHDFITTQFQRNGDSTK